MTESTLHCFVLKLITAKQSCNITRMQPEGRFAPQAFAYGQGEYCLILAFCPFLQALLSTPVWRFAPFYEHYFSDRFGDSSLSTSTAFRTHSEPFLNSPLPTSTTFHSFPCSIRASRTSLYRSHALARTHTFWRISGGSGPETNELKRCSAPQKL